MFRKKSDNKPPLQKNKTKKVLVLCQRKKTNFDTNSTNETIKNLEKFIENYFIFKDVKPEIEYLTPGSGFDNEHEDFADYKFNLVDSESITNNSNITEYDKEETRKFIEKNKGTYSLIILNTCPFIYMPYEALYQLLENDGVITFKRGYGENFDIRSSKKLMDMLILHDTKMTINKYFHDISYQSDNGEVYLLFKKKMLGGNRIYNFNKTMIRKINRKIVKKYKQKTRKYKKYKRNFM
jgi:hypothetical protein